VYESDPDRVSLMRGDISGSVDAGEGNQVSGACGEPYQAVEAVCNRAAKRHKSRRRGREGEG